MIFNFKGFFRFTGHWLKVTGWNARRILIMLAFFIIFPILQASIWFGFLLDKILFRRYRKQAIHAPVFITGMFRSGTTYLHRLMARDKPQFTTMAMWEILFAPSIAQRRIISLFALLIRVPVKYFLNRTEARWQEQNVMHKVSLREPEEDEYLLLHIWSALTTGLSSGLLDDAQPYVYFDTHLEQRQRHRIMGFYQQCIQRHLFAHHIEEKTHYLAKNPALCPKLHTLHEFFPEAKIVYLVRNPLEVIPSFLSMMRFSWRVLGTPIVDSELSDYVMQMARHWYDYPLRYLDKLPEESYIIVNYDELVNDPCATVKLIYQRLALPLSTKFMQTLQLEAEKASAYHSKHDYSLAELGLEREKIVTEFQDIFERFGFDSNR